MGCAPSRTPDDAVRCPFLIDDPDDVLAAHAWIQCRATDDGAMVLRAAVLRSAAEALERGTAESPLTRFSLNHVVARTAVKTPYRLSRTGKPSQWPLVALMIEDDIALASAGAAPPDCIAALIKAARTWATPIDRGIVAVIRRSPHFTEV